MRIGTKLNLTVDELSELSSRMKQRYERIYVTRAVETRIRSLRHILRRNSSLMAQFSAICDYDTANIYNYIHVNKYPMLKEYLKSAELFGWDLSRDVNYAYGTVMYPPAEIAARLRRVYPQYKTLDEIITHMSEGWTFRYQGIRGCIYYTPDTCSCIGYGDLMKKIMHKEQRKGYPDALSFEA